MRRRKSTIRRARPSFLKRRTRRAGSSGSSGNLTGIVIGGAIYGIGREYVNKLAEPITSKIPMGKYADNVVMGALSYFLAKGKIPFLNKIPMSKEIGKAGLYIESAMTGQDLASGMGLSANNNNNAGASW